MGEVYKARDTRLDRTVAVKILPSSLAADPGFRERFDREARTISSLDHPNICVLHDVGRDAGVDYLVMQYIDGETLAARLERGPLPVGQAVEYASQMAAALDRAHRAGIVHRDLKPGNVMVTRASGQGVKLLDFGLAKTPIVAAAGDAVQTRTTPLTGQGTIVGTLQYMAPEQLEGRDVDARTDVFALGAIVYEMLTARRAFEAASQAGVMSAILSKEPPPISSVQPLAPPALDRIVQRCLAKDPDARWQSASDLAAALSWIRTDSGAVIMPARRGTPSRGWIVAAAVVALLAVALGAGGLFRRDTSRPRPIHALLAAPSMRVALPEISPDGTTVVWSDANPLPESRQTLWLQPLDSPAGRAIPGTEGGMFAFWSPDSRSVAFFADQKLKRVDISGGAAATICEAPDTQPRGGSWSADGTIIFSAARIGALSRVPASGGTPQPLTTLDKARGHTTHRWPYFLPDGRHFLYFASRNIGLDVQDVLMFGSLDGGESKVVRQATSNAVYADGRLLFATNGRLMSQPFDPKTGSISGEPVSVAENVPVGYGITRALFSAAGSVLLAPTADVSRAWNALRWIARDGSTQTLAESAYNSHALLSPDGRRLAVSIDDVRARSTDVWTIDVASGARTRQTFAGPRWTPAWSSDGTRLYYMSEGPANSVQLMSKALAGGDERIVARKLPVTAGLLSCSADYCMLSAWQPEAGTNYDLLAVRLSDGVVVPAVASAADENNGRLSPDGKLLAYALEQNGEENVFVRTFPSGSGLWQVSTGGGHEPVWSRDGRELYYLSDRDLIAVKISMHGGFTAGPPRVVRSRSLAAADGSLRMQHAQVAPDGRVLAEMPRTSDAGALYRLMLNWNR
jgi:serine/threonine protein kinase